MQSPNKLGAVRQRVAQSSSSDGEKGSPPVHGDYSAKTVAQTSIKVCRASESSIGVCSH